ncbi:MAG TPA: DUF3553 domain-containing protein [Azoarcus taiwanensis]|nr:DUF3553 domain-containing protein [Azoarcus taiwanensis]
MIVTHPNRPEWGPGRVLAVQGDAVTVYFRDLPIGTAGDATRTIRVRIVQLVPAELQDDPWLEAIPPLRDGLLRLPKPHATPGQALQGFLAHFAEGCQDASYRTSERGPAWSAHESLRASLGDGQGEALLAEGCVSEVLERLRAAKRTANLLSTAERAMVAALLADSESVPGYLRALFGRYLADLTSRGGASQLPRYRQVREMHAGFHTLAGQVLRLAQAGRQDQARVLCETDLQTRGIALLAAMSAWVKEIEGRLAGQTGQHVRSEVQP